MGSTPTHLLGFTLLYDHLHLELDELNLLTLVFGFVLLLLNKGRDEYMARTKLNELHAAPKVGTRDCDICGSSCFQCKQQEVTSKGRQGKGQSAHRFSTSSNTDGGSSTTSSGSSSPITQPVKDERLRTILEEKRLSMDGVVDKNSAVWDTLLFQRLEVFTRPRGPYIPTWVREFYAASSDLVPQGKKKASAFKPVEFVMVRGKKVSCSSDDINTVFEMATDFEHEYQSIIITKTLDDLKGWLAPLIWIPPRGGLRPECL
uniref:Putative plant transposon protein domain-containing protein n=1 Tax=Solanum tuberosum TaxID=4113 RepID=M1DPP3_SOLTU